VDGPGHPPFGTDPSIPPTSTVSEEHSVDLGVPALLFGSGLGPEPKLGPVAPACAPALLGYKQYFKAFNSTTYEFVATTYGHMDIINAEKDGCWWPNYFLNCVATTLCKGSSDSKRKNPILMRYLGTLMGAFLEYALKDKPAALQELIAEWQSAPITLEPPEVFPPDFHVRPKRAVVEADSVYDSEPVLQPAYPSY